MRITCALASLLVLMVSLAQTPTRNRAKAAKATPLILEKTEGEHRIFRPWPGHPEPGAPFILKVDPQNGGSSHLVLGTESLPPGDRIDAHRHPSYDEILFLENGTARVALGDTTREVHGGAVVFIPANTWISVANIGKEAIGLVFVFSAPGFEEFMREESVREGEKNTPVSQAEDEAIQKKHAHDVVYKEP